MNAILYLNNVYYCTIEVPDHRPVIYWAVPSLHPPRYYRIYGVFHSDEWNIIEFRHTGLDYYHCNVSDKLERVMRDRRGKSI